MPIPSVGLGCGYFGAYIKNTQKAPHPIKEFTLPIKPLLYFEESITDQEQTGIPFSWKEYLSLVDWTGRAVRNDKRGAIANHLPPILQRLGVVAH